MTIGLFACRITNDESIRSAALLLPRISRFRDALAMMADGRYAEAADLYQRLGSLPLAAEAHMLAATGDDAGPHLEALRAFAAATGSRLYSGLLRSAAADSSSARSA